MSNQVIVDALQSINIREKQLKALNTYNSKNVKVKIEGNSFNMSINGIGLQKKIDRPLIHIIGAKAWKISDYNQINEKWEEHRKTETLSRLVQNTLIQNQLIIRYNQNNIYGIFTPNFQYVNPINFRNVLLKDLNSIIPINSISEKVDYTPYGEVIEVFNLDTKKTRVVNSPVKIDLGIIYGLNNGYSSYRVILKRSILKCTNGLTSEENTLIRWKHNKEVSLKSFSNKAYNFVLEHHTELTRKIERSKKMRLHKKLGESFFDRLHVSKVAKDRVIDRLRTEIKEEGYNEWALSQALTNVGTHFYNGFRDKYNREVLIHAGTKILENNLKTVLQRKSKIVNSHFGKSYDFLLPKGFGR